MEPGTRITDRIPLPGERLITAVKLNGNGRWVAQVWVLGSRKRWSVVLPRELGKEAAWQLAREMYEEFIRLQDARDEKDTYRCALPREL